MKRALGFAAATAVLFLLGGWGAIRFFPSLGQDGARAVVMSGGIAFSVQMLTFGIVRFFEPTNVMAGRGMGMLVRFLTLVLHGFVGAQLLGLPVGAALVSLAAFFFAATLIEPFFLGDSNGPGSGTSGSTTGTTSSTT